MKNLEDRSEDDELVPEFEPKFLDNLSNNLKKITYVLYCPGSFIKAHRDDIKSRQAEGDPMGTASKVAGYSVMGFLEGVRSAVYLGLMYQGIRGEIH